MLIFIDTEIWVFAQKVPDPSHYPNELEYKKLMKIHKHSNDFLRDQISKNDISMTYHQFCEIYHSLGFRGMKLPKKFVKTYCNQLLSSKFIHWYQISLEHIKKAVALSIKNGIHIWDYLCVLPLYKDVDILYSCDEHFKHSSFQSLGPKVENPIKEWVSL